jgi:hypothetical protein
MALAASIATLAAVAIFAVMAAAFGHRLLRTFDFAVPSDALHLLCALAAGVICFEVLLFFAQMVGHIRVDVVIILLLFAVFGASEASRIFSRASQLARAILAGSKLERSLGALTAVVLGVEGLAAMAPLTGSDALHYHFTGPLLVLRSGFHPDLFLSYSLFCGQSHLLILAALALGSDQLAMGLLFLGGVAAAAAGACLARQWSNREWSWTVALVLLLTPVTFWQISSAGAPDLWMALFATLGVSVIGHCQDAALSQRASLAIVAGALAGAVAGTKYTGIIVAATIAAAYFREVRELSRWMMFVFAALVAGVWPYARNFAWTGDPVFPFLTTWISPARVNTYTWNSYLGDTGAADHHGILQVLEFPFFAAVDQAHPGFWQYLGPLVLAFAPLLILAVRRTPAWRAAMIVWIFSALGVGVTSGMMRFVLPVLPIAIAAVVSGAAQLAPAGLRKGYHVAIATVGGLVLSGLVGLVVYERPALAAAAGVVPHDQYLRARAPEYEDAQFINDALAGEEAKGKALVFLRHTYYLRVPFLYGDPSASWNVDPSRLRTPEQWQEFFRGNGIHWVVRSPRYPEAIAAPLETLEARGTLVPIARSEVSDFQGMRISGQRGTRSIVVLKISNP